MTNALLVAAVVVGGFFLVYNLMAATLLGFAAVDVLRRDRRRVYGMGIVPRRRLPSLTAIVPAYNEEVAIVANVRALLDRRYRPFEVLVVDDGSTDGTFAHLANAFDLVEVPLGPPPSLATAPLRSLHVSRTDPRVRVLRKENGGRSDACNAGISMARGDLVTITDGDSLVEQGAFERCIRPYEEWPAECVAVGGSVRVVNGSTVDEYGRVQEVRAPRRALEAIQVLEYLRGIVAARVAWARVNGLLIISGAFGVFSRDILADVGGFAKNTLGEDMEVTMRLHTLARRKGKRVRVAFVPDAVCWTEAPSDLHSLRGQRIRWHVGLLDNLRLHRRMLLRARYGSAGLIAMPGVVLETLAPLMQLIAYPLAILLFFASTAPVAYVIAFVTVTVLIGEVQSVTALLVEDVGSHRYTGRDLVVLSAWGLVETLWYRPIVAAWQVWATVLVLAGRRPGWGEIPRGRSVGANVG
jgi:cellulose synthase/poly-beta-1,6-N-acetylglucosamine synthase-like glycosyltransferase